MAESGFPFRNPQSDAAHFFLPFVGRNFSFHFTLYFCK
jgi:hypothetical protein